MAAILPTATRTLAASSAADLGRALSPLAERVRERLAVKNLFRLLPLSSRLADALEPRQRRTRATVRARESRRKTDLLGVFEASLILGVERSQFARWLARDNPHDGIAKPVARLKAGPIWLRSQIEAKVEDLYKQRTGNTDREGMNRWARERSRRAARRQRVDPALVEHLLAALAADPPPPFPRPSLQSAGWAGTRDWTRDTPELVGVYEASLILALERSRFGGWLTGNDKGKQSIATPVARLMCGPIWTRSQIDSKLAELYRHHTNRNDDEGMRRWARERSIAAGERRGLDRAEVERVLAGQPSRPRVAGNQPDANLGEALRLRVSRAVRATEASTSSPPASARSPTR